MHVAEKGRAVEAEAAGVRSSNGDKGEALFHSGTARQPSTPARLLLERVLLELPDPGAARELPEAEAAGAQLAHGGRVVAAVLGPGDGGQSGHEAEQQLRRENAQGGVKG